MTDTNSQPIAPATPAPKAEAPVVDVFGQSRGGEEPVETPVETPDADDTKVTPTERIAKMSEELGTVKTKLETSESLHAKKDADIRAMAEKIKAFERGNGGAPTGGTKQEGGDDLPFKEIKTSADLTEDEKDEMTDAEIKALDEMATLKKTVNEQHIALKGKGTTEKPDVATTVKTAVLAITDDVDVANEIIEAFNGSKFNVAEMTAEEIQKAVDMVANTVTGYKPSRESTSRPATGKPAGGGTKTDPYGVNKIVEQVSKQTGAGETYSL